MGRRGTQGKADGMTTLTLRGNQIGQALQFDSNANTTAVEIGAVWFKATDTVRITFGPATFDPVTGQLIGGAGAVTGLTVTTAGGQVTTFGVSAANALDVDPDQSKNGADFFYISESPSVGTGGAYAGLQLEKIMVSDIALVAGTSPVFSQTGGYLPTAGTANPPPPRTQGTPDDDVLTGTNGSNTFFAGAGNDQVQARGGNDGIFGGDGNDIIDAGTGIDTVFGGAGNDLVWGAAGNDQIFGGAGDDVIDGGAGADRMTGDDGADVFVFGAGDRVLDFDRNEGDQIHFAATLGVSEADLRVTTTAQGTVISAAGVAGTMVLQGYFGPLDVGNDFKFDHVPNFDFL